MPTFTALTTLPDRQAAQDLGDALERLSPEPTGVGVFEMEDGSGLFEVGGYFDAPPDQAGLALLATIHSAKPFAVSELPDVNWVAHVKRELVPVEAGRFFVYGSHDAEKVPTHAIPLLIEASMAFGTGHHGTTLGCLKAFDQLIDEGFVGHRVLDLGCGTAVLAMAAARIWRGTFIASDIDEVAVDVAKANLAANGLTDQVEAIEAVGTNHPRISGAGPFDLVFANILKGPLIDMVGDVTAILRPGGRLILSGILNEQADDVVDVYSRAGNNLLHHAEIGDWTTLMLSKSV